MEIRIRGLVRAINGIRERLRHGILPQDEFRFRYEISSLLRQVEAICSRHGGSPSELPRPSRNAYRLLQQICHEPLPQPSSRSSDLRPLRLRRLVQTGHFFASVFWERLDLLLTDPTEVEDLRLQILERVQQIEEQCLLAHASPASLELPSRQIYCWLRFLTEPDRLTEHLTTLQTARSAILAFVPAGLSLQIELLPLACLWRLLPKHHRLFLRCNQGFLSAPAEIWEAIGEHAFRLDPSPHARSAASFFAESESFQDTLLDLFSPMSLTDSNTQGRIYDLDAIFRRVNQRFFASALSRPTLLWNRTVTARKFGHYQPSTDRLMISISLDDPSVPPFVLDFVMYHELLHKKHGIAFEQGRRVIHPPAFRLEERAFPFFTEAEAFLRDLASRLR